MICRDAREFNAQKKGDVPAIMRKVRSVNTTPEVEFRKALWSMGLRFRVAPRFLPGKPDVILSKAKVAVFIDGEYWHGGEEISGL